jgi:Zn-dependent protease with chaperone function
VTPYRATFHDGRTAARRSVAVTLAPEGLRITGEDGRELALWAYQALGLVDERFAGRPLRLKLAEDDGARLTMHDDAVLAELAFRAPQLRERRSGSSGIRIAALGIAGMVLFGAIVWLALPRLALLVASVIPVSWEEALGERVFDDIAEAFASLDDDEAPRFCEAAAGRAALDRLSARLAAAMEATAPAPYRFRVFVLDLKMPNAFALPGGWIVLFRGLISSAEDSSEVAGVLAHEMGHVTHRHVTQNIMRAMGLRVLFDLIMGDMGDGLAGGLGQVLVYLSYNREAEAEADVAALALLEAAGIGAQGLARFFERLAETSGDMPAALQLFSTHPSHDARARLFAAAAARGGAAMSAEDWTALKGICGE